MCAFISEPADGPYLHAVRTTRRRLLPMIFDRFLCGPSTLRCEAVRGCDAQ